MRGSETSDQPTTVLDNRRSKIPRVPLPCLHRSSVNREDHLLMLYDHPPPASPIKPPQDPRVLVLLTYRFIFCYVEPFTLSRLLSLFHHSPISCSLSVSFSLPLSPSSSLVVRIHPTAEWLLCLCIYTQRGSLSIWSPLSLTLFSNLTQQPLC